MTVPEYIQLRAFCRVDGLKLFALWLASFLCYMQGLHSPGLGLLAMVLVLATPFLSYRLLRKFRDEALDGSISFLRGWLYVMFQFFYASLLFAVAQFIYFAYIDKGAFVNEMSEMLAAPETIEAMRWMGMGASVNEMLEMMRQLRPIDLVFSVLLSNLFTGCLLGLPIAAFAASGKRDTNINQN